MSKGARKKSSSVVYHVIARGINKQRIFKDEEDYLAFMEKIKKYNAFNRQLLLDCDQDMENLHYKKKVPIRMLFQRNRPPILDTSDSPIQPDATTS